MPEAELPQNAEYLLLGLIVVFGIVGGYVGSIFWRFRNLQKDRQLLQELQREDGGQ